jgi:hypothetical protein
LFGIKKNAFTGGSVITFGGAKSKEFPKGTSQKKASSVSHTPLKISSKKNQSSTKPAPITPSFKASNTAPFKVRQSVKHAKFGIGLVTEIEEKSNDVFFITVSFKVGKKKLDSKFLTQI